jgi:hypothetical protein
MSVISAAQSGMTSWLRKSKNWSTRSVLVCSFSMVDEADAG